MDKTTKKIFNKIGLALAAAIILINVFQALFSVLILKFIPDFYSNPWFPYILVSAVYIVGLPVFFVMVKNLPSYKKKEVKKLSLKEILIQFFISYTFLTIINIFTIALLYLVSLMKGSSINNPLNSMFNNGSTLGSFIFAGILSPIVEEILFRGIMLDKLRFYGDKIAIITTAIAFGLFHQNFSQFFYAIGLGLIFAYVTIKTGTIKYSIILHIMVNMMGCIVSALASNNITASAIIGLLIIIFVILGIIFLIKKRNNISLSSADIEIEKGNVFNTVCLNFGMIFYFIICFGSMIYILIFS